MPILGESDDEEADEGVSIEYAPGSLSGEADDGDEDDDEDDEVGGGTA